MTVAPVDGPPGRARRCPGRRGAGRPSRGTGTAGDAGGRSARWSRPCTRVAGGRGLMVTSGGWRMRAGSGVGSPVGADTDAGRDATRTAISGPGLRSQAPSRLGRPRVSGELCRAIEAEHRRVGGSLVLIGAPTRGTAWRCSPRHHPELSEPADRDRLLPRLGRSPEPASVHARDGPRDRRRERRVSDRGAPTERERARACPACPRRHRAGDHLECSADEQREFNGATCDRDANAATVAALAATVQSPVTAWATRSRHGHDLWDHGRGIMAGRYPGQPTVFPADGSIPPSAVCG